MTPTDQLLAQRAARGDAAAFEALHDRHAAAVRRTALGILRDADAAGDVVQATFARAWSALARGQAPAEPRAWLHAIARNAALDELRARRRVGPGDAAALDGIAEQRAHGDPEASLREHELSSLLWDAATELSTGDHELLVLHVRRGLDAEALAGRLGVRVSAMHTRLSRLRATLREVIVANVLSANGHPACPVLAALVTRPELQRDARARRRYIGMHADDCERCRDATRPAAILAGLLPFPVADAWAATRRALVLRLALVLAAVLVASAAGAGGLGPADSPPPRLEQRTDIARVALTAMHPGRATKRPVHRRSRRRPKPAAARPQPPVRSATAAARPVPPAPRATAARQAPRPRRAARTPRRTGALARSVNAASGLGARPAAPRSPQVETSPAPPLPEPAPSPQTPDTTPAPAPPPPAPAEPPPPPPHYP